MQIVTLQTKDFRGLPNDAYDFQMDNIIRGRNGSGKSSIADAIIFALYGRTRSGNLSTDCLIHESSESTMVAVQFDTGTTVIREQSRFYGTRIQLNGEATDQGSLEANLPDFKTFISIFLPGYFADQDESDQRSQLLGYSVNVDMKDLFTDYTHKPELLKKYLIDFSKIDKESKNYKADEKRLKEKIEDNTRRRTYAEEQIKSYKKPQAKIDVDKVTEQIALHEAWDVFERDLANNDRIGKEILAANDGTCSSCGQLLPESIKSERITKLGSQRVELNEPKSNRPKATIWELREKLSNAKAVNALFDNYEEQILEFEGQKLTATKEIEKDSLVLSEISTIVEALSPKGIRAQAARKQIQPIIDAINEFTSDGIKIKIETLKQLKTKSDMKEVFEISSNEVPYKYLSTGERKQIDIAISQAINKLSDAGISMYFVDDAELISEPYSLTGQVFKAYVTSEDLTMEGK